MRDNLHVRMTAEQYDTYTASAVSPWDDLLIGRLLEERATRPSGGQLLDLGTGTAVLLVKLCSVEAFHDVALIGSDLYEDMLAVARERVRRAGLAERVRIDREDVHALTYADKSARYVVSRSTIHHWQEPVQAFREIHRVLEPGGVALIHDIRRDLDPALLRHLDEMRSAAGLGPTNLEEKYTPDEARSMCERAGIADVTRISAPDTGPGAIGFEVRVVK
jgi:ubiquinone/menaquinone biosynthesis C-methylase UbiE